MQFVPVNNLVRLVSLKKVQTKTGKDLVFANVTNVKTFENGEFLLDVKNCDVSLVTPGSDYMMMLNVDNRFSSVVLKSAK